ncbi:MBL fold metallo-hydrolase [Patescibacteria group bacterium]|nr:MBL fold metallo-hydrolase [Patescibacteria group bacterium]
MDLGTTQIHVVTDGTLLIDGGTIFGAISRSQWELHIKPDRGNRIRLALNCMLVQTPKMNILVDTGAGDKRLDLLKEEIGLNGNKLLKKLHALGLTPRDIGIVILTSLQFDHCGGATKFDRFGNSVPTFPKATYWVQRACWQDALNPNERTAHRFHLDDFLPLEEKGVLEFLDEEDEIIEGLNVKMVGGPSAGHQIVTVARGGEKVVFASDLIPTRYHVPLQWIPSLDSFPNETLEEKRKLLDMIVDGGWIVIFGHGQDIKAGHVERQGDHLRVLPVELEYKE